MKILLTNNAMNFLSGSPLYTYELARQLNKNGHQVTVASVWEPVLGDAAKLRRNLEAEGVECIGDTLNHYDVAIVSQRQTKGNADKVINVIHSEYDMEAPLKQADHYIAVRPSIKTVLEDKYGIEPDKVTIIFNGVDTQRFNTDKRKERFNPNKDYKVTLVPCTLDGLRQGFLEKMVSEADKDNQVVIMGYNHGVEPKLPHNQWAKILPDKFDIENYIAQADSVAGILLGRVNMESAFCNVPSVVYHPDTLEKLQFVPGGYRSEWDIKNTTQQLENVIRGLL